MKPTFALVLALSLALAAPACKTATTEAPESAPKASTYDGEGKPKIKFGDGGTGAGSSDSGGPGVLGYAMVPFKNIVYIPWKLIGGGSKGASDGVMAGFSKDRMPVLGVIFSPVNLITGFATGAVEGVALQPTFVGTGDSFGRAMAQPTKHATSIWWYE